MSVTTFALPGMEFLGSTKLGAAAANTATVTIAPRDLLVIVFRVTGYSGADIASFQFGSAGTIDTAANYWSRHVAAVTPGSVTLTELSSVSQTLIRVAQNTVTTQRSGMLTVNNLATSSKLVSIQTSTSSNAANTAASVQVVGGGEWVNTTAQINVVRMITAGGTNLNAGSGFAVYGVNF